MRVSTFGQYRGTLTDRLVPGGLVRDAIFMIAAALFIALSAQIAWGSPVPVTGQTLAVLLVGATGGVRRGGASLLLYLGGGTLGLPFFSEAGPATYGYLVGFAAAALVVGFLSERGWDRSYRRAVVAMFAGNVVIYIFGLPWLGYYLNMSFSATLSAGLTPFIPGDVAKLLIAAAVLPSAWRLTMRGRASDKAELTELLGDDRRTTIGPELSGELALEDLVPDEDGE